MIEDQYKRSVEDALAKHGDAIPDNFVRTAPAYQQLVQFQTAAVNPQVTSLLKMIGVATSDSKVQISQSQPQAQAASAPNPEEIQLDL